MLMNRPIPTTIFVIGSFALPACTASAHPSSGIVVDQQGQVFFQDILGVAIWKIDAQGKLTKYYDKLGGHWMALDAEGAVYAAATGCHRVVKIARDGKVKVVLQAERPWSPTAVAVHGGNVYVLEYTNANGGAADGWTPRVRKLARDGKVTTLATVPPRPKP